jgi:hypothetical protein
MGGPTPTIMKIEERGHLVRMLADGTSAFQCYVWRRYYEGTRGAG